jgi:uridine kinase
MKVWNSHIIDFIYQAVNAIRTSSSSFYVCIDGFTGTGKTVLGEAIAATLISGGIPVISLCTDHFIRFTREERKSNPALKENHQAWYNLKRLQNIAITLGESGPLDLILHDLYNHTTGRVDLSTSISVNQKTGLVIEGMYALQLTLSPLYTVVLVADHHELQKRVYERDRLVRGIDAEESEKRYWIHNGLVYQTHLATKIKEANLVVDTTNFTEPSIITSSQVDNGFKVRSDILRDYAPHYYRYNMLG